MTLSTNILSLSGQNTATSNPSSHQILKMRTATYILFLAYLSSLMLISCQKDNRVEREGIIDIEKAISANKFSIHSLSDYASEIRYVRLETLDNALIGNRIRKMHLEDNKLFVHHCSAPYVKVFDAHTGKFLHTIGGRGQGPGELAYLTFVDINVQNQRVLLSWSGGVGIGNEFDFYGNFIGRIHPPSLNYRESFYHIVMLCENLFAGNIQQAHRDAQENAVVVFNRDGKVINVLKSYNDPILHPVFITWCPSVQGGIFYRSGNDVMFYRAITDTIYVFNRDKKNFVSHFPIHFGRHQDPHDWTNPRAPRPPHLILIKIGGMGRDNNIIAESSRFIFFDFAMFRNAPEPFEDSFIREGQVVNFTNQDVYGIFDKQNHTLEFLLQPIPGVRGLKNDLDGGIPFFPKTVSSTGKMLDWHQAYRFIELAEKLPNPNESFLQVLRSIDEDDNPIVVIVTPKE